MTDSENVRRRLKDLNQEHLLEVWNDISIDDKKLLKEISSCLQLPDENCRRILKLQPLPADKVECADECKLDLLRKYENIGLREISRGRVGAVVLAGGQGSRLGASRPKGAYDIGLPSRKSLFQIQAERIQKLERLANERTLENGSITWYVMTSDVTKSETEAFFEANDYFGVDRNNLVIFNQRSLPAFDVDKRLLLENKNRLAFTPDGNGGIYASLGKGPIFEDMQTRGVQHLYVYSVDNVLVKVADPIFLGYCVDKNADCGAKAVRKTNPSEKIGVFCTIDGEISVAEYSEIDEAAANLRDDRGGLVLDLGNICNHYFSIDFLEDVANNRDELLKTHLVRTKSGFKMERFIFDGFKASRNFVVWEVARDKEFAALKNSDDADDDCAKTSRNALFCLHKRYVEEAGGAVIGDIVEISPLVSYAGENLEDLVKNLTFEAPLLLNVCN